MAVAVGGVIRVLAALRAVIVVVRLGVRVVVDSGGGCHRMVVMVPVVLHTGYRVMPDPLQPLPSYLL
ncbi:hypothetical protein [Streptacidiphilus cavernicola]|uniref:Secreted protein n=1 Tax=Streptacidiphilus cavernicola TaxID=3342716 RepID=A0ABV6VVD1_9ACTN